MKPSEFYSSQIELGKLNFDQAQYDLLKRLDVLSETLKKRSRSWFFKKKVKGLYVRGEVGRGKTQLMDIFTKPLKLRKKEDSLP